MSIAKDILLIVAAQGVDTPTKPHASAVLGNIVTWEVQQPNPDIGKGPDGIYKVSLHFLSYGLIAIL